MGEKISICIIASPFIVAGAICYGIGLVVYYTGKGLYHAIIFCRKKYKSREAANEFRGIQIANAGSATAVDEPLLQRRATAPVTTRSPGHFIHVHDNIAPIIRPNYNTLTQTITTRNTGPKPEPSGTRASTVYQQPISTATNVVYSPRSTVSKRAESTMKKKIPSDNHIVEIPVYRAPRPRNTGNKRRDESTDRLQKRFDDVALHGRQNGGANWRQKRNSGKTGNVQSTRWNERKTSADNGRAPYHIPFSQVKMPNGLVVSIPVPSKPKCLCTTLSDSRMIPIWPNSKVCDEEYEIVCDQMNNTIMQHMSGSFTRYNIISVHKVKNCCLWMKFRNRQLELSKEGVDLNERMLFHGSAAVDDILKTGFDERHSSPAGMFGAGIYFAEHSSKSNQYAFGFGSSGCDRHSDRNCYICVRTMLLCRVTLGCMHWLTHSNRLAHAPPGHHSVKGTPSTGGLQYPEYIIYRGEQAYPEYQITYKVVP